MKNMRIGEVLLEEGCISKEQLDKALELQKQDKLKRIGEILIENGMVTEDQMLSALSKRLSVEIVSFSDLTLDINSISKIPKNVAVKYKLIAVSQNQSSLVVVINDPLNFYAIEDIKLIVNMPLEIKIAKANEITSAINYWYSEIDARNAARDADSTVNTDSLFQIEDLSGAADDTPVVALVNTTLLKAYSSGASDIHFEPFDEKTSIRIRVDGQLVEFLTISSAIHQSVISRIKILSSLDIAEKRLPQDGHFRAKFSNEEVNIRVSILPTIHGEKAVLRFLGQTTNLDYPKSFGMGYEDYNQVSKILQSPHGIVYITGPTGSGKTTTLYMILEELSKKSVNISTIEDPVEKNLPKVNQTQTNALAGLTFERGLRSLLRQDPDIIMVGETRDSETATIAVRAAITGHLVLSTLHTNDAIAAITRLSDMGVEDYMIANSLVGVVAQRLAKKICTNCKKPYTPNEEELKVLGKDVSTLYKGEGCGSCNHTGYKGRIAVHEVLSIDSKIRSLISNGESVEKIYDYVSKNNKIKTLKDSLSELVISGVSTVEELLKLTYFVD